jgi:acetyl-CoA carboxylase carboxyl transferase subunit alpha
MTTAWERVKLARHPQRPTAIKLIKSLFPDFIELHGDRMFADDKAIIGGLGTLNGITFHRPILCIIDTPGAYPGIGAEERGQASAIATNLKEMMGLKTPIIVVVLSEGGSGGALAIGVGDHVYMFENSVYAILSPEGYASIIYKDSQKADVAAELMKLTAEDLLHFHVIDEIIQEGEGLHINPDFGFDELKKRIIKSQKKLVSYDVKKLLKSRYQKFRTMGVYREQGEQENESTT